jgi:DNA-directed RNA polymerase specialized sigma24 family protein
MADGVEHLSLDEVGRLLSRQRQADLLRLAALAETWARGIPRRDASDLLNEALARILSGDRPWPADISLHAFLSQVMRSIASQWRHEDTREPLAVDQIADIETRRDVTRSALNPLQDEAEPSPARAFRRHEVDRCAAAPLIGSRRSVPTSKL